MTGRAEAGNFASCHQILNRACWSPRAVARRLLGLVVERLVPDGPVVIGIDDTIERRRHWQQIGLAICQPLLARCGLALRAMPVAAGIIRDTAMAAVFAGLKMTAKRCSPTELDSRHDTALHAAEMAIVGETISLAMAAEYIRHLQFAAHRC
jgi:hypothetical protein